MKAATAAFNMGSEKDRSHDNGSHDDQGCESSPSSEGEKNERREDGKVELTEEDNYEHLGFTFSTSRKWQILTVAGY